MLMLHYVTTLNSTMKDRWKNDERRYHSDTIKIFCGELAENLVVSRADKPETYQICCVFCRFSGLFVCMCRVAAFFQLSAHYHNLTEANPRLSISQWHRFASDFGLRFCGYRDAGDLATEMLAVWQIYDTTGSENNACKKKWMRRTCDLFWQVPIQGHPFVVQDPNSIWATGLEHLESWAIPCSSFFQGNERHTIRSWKKVIEGSLEGSLEVKLPTIWTDEKQSREEAERRERVEERRSEKRKSQKKADADAGKGRKVARHCVFPMIWGSGGSKSRLAKAAGAEAAGQMRDEKLHAVVARSTFPSQNVQSTWCSEHFWKLRCRKSARPCGAKHISKSTCTKHTIVGPLLEVEMSKKCMPLRREAHFEVKMYKAPGVRTTFGSSDVEKVHAVVARSTFRSQNVKNTRGSDHFGGSDVASLRFASFRFTTLHYITLHSTTVHYTTRHYTPQHYNYNYTTTLHYTPLHSTTLNYTTLHYTPLHYTTLHYTTLHYTTLHYLPLHFATLRYTPPHYNYKYNYTTTLHYTPLHSTTLNYTTLHYTTLRYIPLHSTTLHYITLNDTAPQIDR